MSTPPSDLDAALPAPIPFITLSEDSVFSVSPEAVAYLRQLKGNLAVVAIAGLYRTGKSYLLNLLLGRDRAEAMFSVGATVNACTKGIWIWGQPAARVALADDSPSLFQHLPKDTTVIFLDTEGLGSTQRSATQDTRLFALALLLASLFIYNSRGVIDSSAIEDLSLVVNLTKYIQTKARSLREETADGQQETASELATFFPDFLWIVRDFTLQLEEDGRKVTPRDYFESALKQQPPLTDEVVEKNRIRALLSTFFPVRDCVTMVRPLNDENLLRELIHQPYESLRPEFREQLDAIKTKVFSTLKPKKMMSKPLTGPMLVALAENYVAAFNSGASPVISSVWDRVLESQLDQALDAAKDTFDNHFRSSVAAKTSSVTVNRVVRQRPLEDEQLAEIYSEACKLAEHELAQNGAAAEASTTEAYFVQLSDYMLGYMREQYASNDALSTTYNVGLLQDLFKPEVDMSIEDPASSSDSGAEYLRTRLTSYKDELEKLCTSYATQAVGCRKDAILCDFLADKMMEGLLEWGSAVHKTYRAQASQMESSLSSTQQALRAVEGKVRAAQEVLAQQKESYERALQSISERTTEERATLRDEIQSKEAEIARTNLQIDRLAALHKEALDRLDAQVEEAKAERRRLETTARDAAEQRENERKEASRQLLERERSFHEQEKGLLHGQQQFLQQIMDLERQLGEQDAEQLQKMYQLEKENHRELSDLTLKHQDEQDELKDKMIQEIRELKNDQDQDVATLQSELDDKKALLSALREQLETKEAMAAARRAKANQFFSGAEDCVVQ